MPSRKKLQGQSRKAKRTHATTKANPARTCYHHCNVRNWSKSDADAVNKLAKEYGSKFEALHPENLSAYHVGMSTLVVGTYNKYQQFSESRKDLLKRLMLACGTNACVRASSQRDLTKESSPIREALSFVLMMLEIEVRDKCDGLLNSVTAAEVRKSFDDAVCPRETVRFFHKRNHCDCLKELYYKLKESTKRTAGCWHCHKVFDIRTLSRCKHCNVAQFCSYECAVAMWPEHKNSAKYVRRANNMPTKLVKAILFCFVM